MYYYFVKVGEEEYCSPTSDCIFLNKPGSRQYCTSNSLVLSVILYKKKENNNMKLYTITQQKYL